MGIQRIIFNIILSSCLWLVFPAHAEEIGPLTPLHLNAIYTFQFGGLNFGKIGIESEQSDDHYAIAADVASGGILKLLTRHSSHTVVDGTGKSFHYNHIIYDTRYRTKDKRRSVYLEYKNGKIVKENIQPPENPEKRPPVKADLKNSSIDLLTFNMALRQRFWEALKKGDSAFSMNIYDGRRLTKVDASVLGKQTTTFGDEQKFPVYALKVRRTPVAGFTESELKKVSKNEPSVTIHYSADGRLIPIKIEVPFLFDKLTATLAKECRTGESCLLGIKE